MHVMRRLAPLLLVLAAVAVACGGSSEPSGPTATTGATETSGGTTAGTGPTGETATTGATGSTDGFVAGTWEGTWESGRYDISGTFTMTFEPSADGFAGTIAIQDSDCVSSGDIVAALNGDTISIGAVQAEQQIDFTGTLRGDEMSGDYVSPQGCGNDAGTWEAHLIG